MSQVRFTPDLEIVVSHGEDVNEVYVRHVLASVGEGRCPHHRTPLVRGGDCAKCGKRWVVSGNVAHWHLLIDPITGEPYTCSDCFHTDCFHLGHPPVPPGQENLT